MATITISGDIIIWDAIWTPNGNIVYTTDTSNQVVLVSDNGTFKSSAITGRLGSFSTSNDDIIYLAGYEQGLQESRDNGVTWSIIFKPNDNWHCLQAVKVSDELKHDFWILGETKGNKSLRVYSLDRHSPVFVSWMSVAVPDDGTLSTLSRPSLLTFDGSSNILFIGIKNFTAEITAFSVSCPFHSQKISLNQTKTKDQWALTITVEKQRNILYAGLNNGVVRAFQLLLDDNE